MVAHQVRQARIFLLGNQPFTTAQVVIPLVSLEVALAAQLLIQACQADLVVQVAAEHQAMLKVKMAAVRHTAAQAAVVVDMETNLAMRILEAQAALA